jgi:hypothetical protein
MEWGNRRSELGEGRKEGRRYYFFRHTLDPKQVTALTRTAVTTTSSAAMVDESQGTELTTMSVTTTI